MAGKSTSTKPIPKATDRRLRCNRGIRSGSLSIHRGDYTADEFEFLQAIDRYKRDNRKPFPSWVEVLNVLKGLGWEKRRA